MAEITKKNLFLKKFSQENFRKSHEILDQFDESIKSYIKLFEAGSLLSPSSGPGRVKECFIKYFYVIRYFIVVSYFLLFNIGFPNSILDAMPL